MEKSSEAVKEFLLRENREFQQLARKHQELEERLLVLAGKTFLSDEEKLEEVTLKKKKLAVKDQMAALIRKHQSQAELRREGARSAPA